MNTTHTRYRIFLLYVLLSLWSATTQALHIEAENYDEAFDTTSGNIGGAFRGGDVDIEVTTDTGNGFNVGWIDAGEWLVFHNFIVPVTGSYTISLRVASASGATASVDLNGGNIPLGNVSIPATGRWQNWVTVSRSVNLNAGTFNLGIFAQTNGWNLNWIEITQNALSSSSASSQASSKSSSLVATNSDRSLIIHDEATLQAADFSLRATLQQLVNQLNIANPGHTTTADEFFARMWDTQNPTPGVVAGGEKCTGTLNGFAVSCRQAEGVQASDPQRFIALYQPLALVNRFDLRDNISFSDCGEYRIIYGLTGFGGQRNFIIFEAQVPNPNPGNLTGCLPIAQFWQNMSSENDTANRARALRSFYFNGIASANVGPVVDFRNYAPSSGQIRANMFMSSAWNLKEFKIDFDSQGLSLIKAVSDKSNPVNFLFNAQSTDGRAAAFQTDFVNNLNSLLGDFNSFTLTVVNDGHNRGESFASSAQAADSILANPFFDSANPSFRQAVSNKLTSSGSSLSLQQVIARATAMTCAGCHSPSTFNLTENNSVGPNQTWPQTLGFVHVSEFSSGGVFPLSPALTDVFLPVRKNDLRNYLINSSNHAQFNQTQAVQLKATGTSSTAAKAKFRKRSG